MGTVSYLFEVVEPEDDVFSIPPPPTPFRTSRKDRSVGRIAYLVAMTAIGIACVLLLAFAWFL